jgi:hypothetical protein
MVMVGIEREKVKRWLGMDAEKASGVGMGRKRVRSG